MACGAIALTLAGAASPAWAAFGPSGCLLNQTDQHLILTFDAELATPGNFFHLLHVQPGVTPAKLKSGKGSPIAELATQEIPLGPGDRIFLLQDTSGTTGPSVMAGFKFQLHLPGASRTIPAKVMFTFGYPGPDAGGVRTVAIDGAFPAEYSSAHRFVFTKTPGKGERPGRGRRRPPRSQMNRLPRVAGLRVSYPVLP
jgi:hypothetical protein